MPRKRDELQDVGPAFYGENVEPKPKARMEKWAVIGGHLYGRVYGHPHVEDGCFVQTTRIEEIDLVNNRATTVNTEYELGEKDEGL